VYIRGVTITEYEDGIQLLIRGVEHGGNFDDTGFVLDMNPNKPTVAEMLDFLRGNDLIVDHTHAVRWTQ